MTPIQFIYRFHKRFENFQKTKKDPLFKKMSKINQKTQTNHNF